jgi:hypothetical protein
MRDPTYLGAIAISGMSSSTQQLPLSNPADVL